MMKEKKGKRAPEQRWREQVLLRYRQLLASPNLPRLRRMGKQALGVKGMLRPEAWNEVGEAGGMRTDAYLRFKQECREVGALYGLGEWTVEMACLLRGYDPEESQFIVEGPWARASVVTEVRDSLFLRRLTHEAFQLRFPTILRSGSTEAVLVPDPVSGPSDQPFTVDNRPAAADAFRVRLEVPPTYPPELAVETLRKVQQRARELLRRLGYQSPERMRVSETVEHLPNLRLEKQTLARRETGDIAEDIYGEDATRDPKKRKKVKEMRYQARKRLPPGRA